MAFVFADPALADLVDRHRIEIMQLLAPAPDRGDQVRRLQQQEMLRHRLPCYVQVCAQFAERLAVALMQLVQQLPAAPVTQRFEHCIHLHAIICNLLIACQAPIFESLKSAVESENEQSGGSALPIQINAGAAVLHRLSPDIVRR